MDRLRDVFRALRRPAAASPRCAVWLGAVWLAAGCATRPPPEIPVVPLDGWAYVEDRAPVPGAALPDPAVRALAESWTLIAGGRLGEAQLLLAPLRESAGDDPGVLSAAGFLALRSGRVAEADQLFEEALATAPSARLAALGRVLTILEDADPESLFARLRHLSALDPDASVVAELLPGLTLEIAESRLSRARELARANPQGPAVAEAYGMALEALPNSDDLLLEAAEAAVTAGDGQRAADWFDAVASSASATPRQALLARLASAELLAAEGRLAESLTRLDSILGELELAGFTDMRIRAGELERRLELGRLSGLYGRIREAERVTREQLAALLAVEIGVPTEEGPDSMDLVIAIDLERSWAANLIQTAVGAGYLSLYPDHTFKPRGLVTRAELAESISTALGKFDADALDAALRDAGQLEMSDVPSGHRYREAVATAVKIGLLRISENAMFRPRAFASGAEAVRAVHALRDLLGRS